MPDPPGNMLFLCKKSALVDSKTKIGEGPTWNFVGLLGGLLGGPFGAGRRPVPPRPGLLGPPAPALPAPDSLDTVWGTMKIS